MSRRRLRIGLSTLVAVVMGLCFALGSVVALHGRAEASIASKCRAFAAAHTSLAATTAAHPVGLRSASASATSVPASQPRIVVIGDSWSAGYKLRNPRAGWPSRLPGRVSVDGFSGTGFSAHASPCGAVSYADRTAAALAAARGGRGSATAPDLVVIEGGLNDFDQSRAAVTRGFGELLRRLAAGHVDRSKVLVVGPAPAPSRLAGARRVDSWLASLCADAAVPYLSSIHGRLPYLRDRLHLTPAGHRQFGDFVAAHLP